MLQNNKLLCILLIHYVYRAAHQTVTSYHGKIHNHKFFLQTHGQWNLQPKRNVILHDKLLD